jgi:hypothetical protein
LSISIVIDPAWAAKLMVLVARPAARNAVPTMSLRLLMVMIISSGSN